MPVDDEVVEEYQGGNGRERVAQLLIGARFTASGNWQEITKKSRIDERVRFELSSFIKDVTRSPQPRNS